MVAGSFTAKAAMVGDSVGVIILRIVEGTLVLVLFNLYGMASRTIDFERPNGGLIGVNALLHYSKF